MKPDIQPVADFLNKEPIALNGQRLLAEGDSWFTIGRLLPAKVPSLLASLRMSITTSVINCAYPGDTLRHISDSLGDNDFNRLLCQPGWQLPWDAIVLSGGGNDLIDAAQHEPVNQDGSVAPLAARVLLTPAEAASVKPGDTGATRYVSEEGWLQLARYITLSVTEIARRRDSGINAGRPLILHTYSTPTVWRCGAGKATSGWLFSAFRTYGIPAAEQQGVANELFGRLRTLLLGLASDSGQPQALANCHVFDSAGTVPLLAPDPQATKPSNDWSNEIHPSSSGYSKLGAAFGPFIESVLALYPTDH